MTIDGKFKRFVDDEKSGGLILIACTIVSLLIANSAFGESYDNFWLIKLGGLSIEHWINDALMAVFFLMVGLELEREAYIGEFSKPKNAILPISAAIGGMLIPASFYFLFNHGLPTQAGVGIPMATDIAFALGILSLLGNKVPFSLKVFLMALAVVDDLGAIVVIALFYTKDLMLLDLGIALAIFAFLILLNRLKIKSLIPYFIGGVIMWIFMYRSGIHATITGVLLAFAIPFSGRTPDAPSPSLQLLHKLHVPVAFFILPIFALANTAVTISSSFQQIVSEPESIGILSGLVLGKPIGILLATFLVVQLGFSSLPPGISFKHILGIGFLGGIGFTMSIFITLLAFDDPHTINTSKIAILLSSLLAGIIGFFFLKTMLKNQPNNNISVE